VTTTRGQHLIGKEIGSCILERLLGYGGSSAVFLAHSLTLDEPVAVKVFLPRSTLDGQMRKSFYRRFLREAEAASKLAHPNVLTIYAYGEHEGLPYIVMPYMPGGTLAEHIQKHGPLSLQEARRYLEQIAAALDYAHANGCVHCDVKPANILLDSAGSAALSDFGIVRLMQTEGEDTPSSSKSGEILMGTPDYVSPEQALGEKLDGRSDVYSLGATLYYLMTGEPPFKAESPIALALMHVHEPPTPLGLLRADVTPHIDFVLSKVLAKWPEDRFQTPGAFSMAFELAVKEAGEAPQFSLKHARLAKQASIGEPWQDEAPGLRPVVHIKPVTSTRFGFNPWRLALTFGLIGALLLGCLLTALFIGNLNTSHSNPQATATIPASSAASYDALMGDRSAWPTSSTFFFKSDGYHIQNKSASGLTMAFYSNYQFADFSLSLTTTEISGSFNSADYYGVVFRASADQSRYYLFEVTAWNNGQYGFLRYDGAGHWSRLTDGRITNFSAQAGQYNTLGITAKDDAFTFSINGKQAGKTIRDTSGLALSSGEIGLVVEEQASEVAFSRLYASQLK